MRWLSTVRTHTSPYVTRTIIFLVGRSHHHIKVQTVPCIPFLHSKTIIPISHGQQDQVASRKETIRKSSVFSPVLPLQVVEVYRLSPHERSQRISMDFRHSRTPNLSQPQGSHWVNLMSLCRFPAVVQA